MQRRQSIRDVNTVAGFGRRVGVFAEDRDDEQVALGWGALATAVRRAVGEQVAQLEAERRHDVVGRTAGVAVDEGSAVVAFSEGEARMLVFVGGPRGGALVPWPPGMASSIL
jgi:hypothetical protein